jgi:hypothetical protein
LPTWGAHFCFSARQRLMRRPPDVKRANRLARWNPGGSSSKVRLTHSSARCPTLPKRSIGPPRPWTALRARWRTAPLGIRSRRWRLRRAVTQEIARNAGAAAKGTRDVYENISEVSNSTMKTGQVAATVLTAAGELADQSHLLRKEVERYLGQLRVAS